MRVKSLAILGLITLSGCAKAPPDTFLLPASAGPELVKQCSRASITADEFWKATPRQAEELDHALHGLLANPANKELAAIVDPLSSYHQQIIGYTVGEKRYLYANFYVVPEGMQEFIGRAEATRAEVVCDGGPRYWGATLDLDTGVINTIDSNGMIGGGMCHWRFETKSQSTADSACGCVYSGPLTKRPLPSLPKGLHYCPST